MRDAAEIGLATKAQQDERDMRLDFPRNKRDGHKQMVPGEGGGWTLWYRFHS